MYDVGELSMMMVSLRSRPIWERSYGESACKQGCQVGGAYLDIVALMVVATLSEEAVMNDAVNVQLIQKRVSVLRSISIRLAFIATATHLGNRSCEDNNLVQLAHSLHELIHTRSLDHVNVVVLSFNLHRDREVSLGEYLVWSATCKRAY